MATHFVTTLAGLINAASVANGGDLISIADGTYATTGPIEFNSKPNVRVFGSPAAIITGESWQAAAGSGSNGVIIRVINCDGFLWEGVTLQGPSGGNAYGGIWVQDSNNATFRGEYNDFARPGLGYPVIAVGNCADVVIEDAIMRRCRHAATNRAGDLVERMIQRRLQVLDPSGSGLDFHWSAGAGCQFVDNYVKFETLSESAIGDSQDASGCTMQATEDFVITGNTFDMGGNSVAGEGCHVQWVSGAQKIVTGYIANNTFINVGNDSAPADSEQMIFVDTDTASDIYVDVEIGPGNAGTLAPSASRTLLWTPPVGVDVEEFTSPIPQQYLRYPEQSSSASSGSSASSDVSASSSSASSSPSSISSTSSGSSTSSSVSSESSSSVSVSSSSGLDSSQSSSVSSSSLSSSSISSSLSSGSGSSESSSSVMLAATLFVAGETDRLCIEAYRRRDSQYQIKLLDVEGEPITIHPTNVIRLKIGKDGAVPHLDIVSTEATANGSSVTGANPMTLKLDKDDLRMTAGVYDIEIIVLDSGSAEIVTEMKKGVFMLFETQLGDLATS